MIIRVEQLGKSVATLTRFGWVLMSPGVGAQISEFM